MAEFIMNSEGFGLKIYERFPPRYQEDDADNRFALRRYLDACGDGGFKYGIDEWNGILNFANPDQATSQALPLLYEQYGLPIFNGIPEQYLRYLLPRLGRAWQKKGGIDVIEFVASALAGVRTNTTVKYDQDNNVDIDLRLEMDYALGDYFPDTKQLYRLLEKFLPFYLGMTIIYVYVFHDEFSIHGEDTPRFDIVTYITNEKGLFYSSGLRPVPMTFPPDPRGLNVDFILNQYERVAPDPDPFWDNISIKYREQGSFAHRFAPFDPRVPILNTDRVLNHNFILHGGKLYLPEGVHPVGALNNPDFRLNDLLRTSPPLYIEVDSHLDKVISVPMTDTITPKVVQDDNHDHVAMAPSFYHTLNTGLVLNQDFTLNSDNCEYARVKGVDETSVDILKVIYRENASLTSEKSGEHMTNETNTKGKLLNRTLHLNEPVDTDSYTDTVMQTFSEQDALDIEEDNTMHLTMGTVVCFIPALNVGCLTLNCGLVTNETNVDEGKVSAEDSDTLSIQNTTNEGATFVFSPLLCMLTNTPGPVLNHAALKVPEEIDVVHYRDGTHQTVFR